MPIHDWTHVPDGIFHDFHHAWIEEIKRSLNSGLLPPDYYALAEQRAGGFGPDVLNLQALNGPPYVPEVSAPPVAVLSSPPRAPRVGQTDMKNYAGRQNSVIVRHVSGDRIIALVEIVSPGNKAARSPLRTFVEKAAEALDRGYHLLIIDLLPPGERDPQGIHGAIWSEIEDDSWRQPAGKPLTAAAYEATPLLKTAYVETMGVGDEVPEMPLFLWPDHHVPVPLEATYQSAWQCVPLRWRQALESQASA